MTKPLVKNDPIRRANSEARRARNEAIRSRTRACKSLPKPAASVRRSLLPARIQYLYLFGCPQSNYYKIGISSKPERRLADLNVPFVMEIIATHPVPEGMDAIQAEASVHAEFADRRIHREWFRNIAREDFKTAVTKVTASNATGCNTTLG